MDICVLLYGDYPQLARRCLGSILHSPDWRRITSIRVGLNAVSVATRCEALTQLTKSQAPCFLYEEERGLNVYKYPMMRRMFYDPARPIGSSVMWFDDDTYLTNEPGWWDYMEREREQERAKCDLLGPIYIYRGFHGLQAEGIRQQPWYNQKPISPNYRPRFVQGGWWVARSEILTAWDYPFPALEHNGGDALLGELCRQQNYVMRSFRYGVRANADDLGRESKATRRGATTPVPWLHGLSKDYHHQDFQVRVTAL